MTTTNNKNLTGGNPFIQRVYAAQSVDESRRIYDEWAATFDNDMIEQDYIAPSLVAAAAVQHTSTSSSGSSTEEGLSFLDAGCGSGLVGLECAKLGVKVVDGVDLSPGMLDVARKTGVYGDLTVANLSHGLPDVESNVYDALVCSGTLTQGHVGPGALAEFVRVVKPAGVVVATVLEDIWVSGGYEAEVRRLETEGRVRVVSTELAPYRRSAETFMRLVVLRKV